MSQKHKGIVALFISVLFWGPAPVFTKQALLEVPAFAFAFLGRIIALFILSVIFIPRGALKINIKDLPLLISAGLTGSVFNVGFFIFGIQLTNAMDAQAIFSIGPVITAVLAHFILREKIKTVQGIGVLIGFFGACLIAARSFFESGTLNNGNMLGNLLIFLSSFSWVLYILVSRKLSKIYSPQTITLYSFIVSAIVFAPFVAIFSNQNLSWISHLSFQGMWGILYVGVFASVVAFLAYQVGIKHTSAFVAGVSLYLQPIFTTVFAFIILNEKITFPFIIGTVLIILGSIIATQHELLTRHARKKLGMFEI